MNKRAILIAADNRVRTEIRNMFRNDQQVMIWAANPNDWEICKDGNAFDEEISDYEANEEEIPVAIAYLKPDELEAQVTYPIYDRNGVDVIGKYNSD